jgi:hypothetical protein
MALASGAELQMDEKKKTKLDEAAQSARRVTEAAAAQANVVYGAAARQTRLVVSDIVHAVKNDRQAQMLCIMLGIAILFWEAPLVKNVLYPLKLFETIIHEGSHALAARLTGGQVALIALDPSRSGLTMSSGGIDFLVTCAGYMGSATFGGLLIWWGRKPAAARMILHNIAVVVLALTAFYVGGGWFSVSMAALIGGALFFASSRCSERFCHILLLALAVITTLEGLLSIQYLIYLSAASDVRSDAGAMEGITGIPALAWSLLFGLYSLVVLVFSFWISYRPVPDLERDRASAEANPPAPGS